MSKLIIFGTYSCMMLLTHIAYQSWGLFVSNDIIIAFEITRKETDMFCNDFLLSSNLHGSLGRHCPGVIYPCRDFIS